MPQKELETFRRRYCCIWRPYPRRVVKKNLFHRSVLYRRSGRRSGSIRQHANNNCPQRYHLPGSNPHISQHHWVLIAASTEKKIMILYDPAIAHASRGLNTLANFAQWLINHTEGQNKKSTKMPPADE